MNRLIIIIVFGLLTIQYSSAQGNSSKVTFLKQQLKKRLAFLDAYRYQNHEGLDMEKYCGKTAALLVEFLCLPQSKNISLKEFKNLQLSAKSTGDLQVRVYDFGYNCGGSRGWITHPVIQWQDQDGQLHAFDLSKKILCEFHKLHRLRSDAGHFYLLIGREQGNSHDNQSIAYVIRIDSNKISTNGKAFVNRPYINLINTGITFNDKSQVLQISGGEDEAQFSPDYLLDVENGEFSGRDPVTTKKLVTMLTSNDKPEICLHFQGEKFSKTKCTLDPVPGLETELSYKQFDTIMRALPQEFRNLRGKIALSANGDTTFYSKIIFKGSIRNQIRTTSKSPPVFICTISNSTLDISEKKVGEWRKRLDYLIAGPYSCDALNEKYRNGGAKGYVFTSAAFKIVLAYTYSDKNDFSKAYLSIGKPMGK
jgi:hypothetical protein